MIPGSITPLLLKSAAADGLQIERSLRFNSSDSAYLSRTPASAGNRKTWTWAGWAKRSGIGGELTLFASGTAADDSTFGQIIFSVNNTLTFNAYFTSWRSTAQVLRDPSAWYHIVVAFDTTQATASNRVKIYINGSEVTSFGSSSDPTQNADYAINQNLQHTIGRYDLGGGGNYFPGYLANIHFIDGQALTPSSFTEIDATTGQLIPKTYTGSYNVGPGAVNGFNLLFADNSAATASTLGKDTSGLSNNWTPNYFSVEAGVNAITTPASNAPPTVDYLVVAGGGGGGGPAGGGGGGGGFKTANGFSITTSTTYTVTIGNGGIAGTTSGDYGTAGGNGGNSVFGSITSTGGGGGAAGNLSAAAGRDGGSGGGGPGGSGAVLAGGTGISGQGFAGGTNENPSVPPYRGGGGGGASEAGNTNGQAQGGDGSTSSITGSSVTYAGGGGAGENGATTFAGGAGGGGNGGFTSTAGTANTGGGGGGGYHPGGGSKAGGSGIVILRYANTYDDLIVGSGLTYTYVNTGGYKIYSFTASVTPAQYAGNDSLVDSPTNYGTDTGVGGEVRGNYCTLNPLDNSSGLTLANGNLDGSETGGGHKATRATIKFPVSGKWYYEGTVTTLGGACCIGAATNAAANPDINASGSYYILVNSSGNVQRYQSFSSYTGFDTPLVGTILRVAYDADAQKLWLGLNGLWMNSSTGTTGDPATGANATFSSVTDIYPAIDQQTSAVAVNFGQRAFAYTAPSGFKVLCTQNLPAPLVTKSNQHFNIITYPGNGSTQTLPNATSTPATALDFGGVGQIGFSWIKQRSDPSTSHALYDARRGVQARLESDTTDQEATSDNGVTAFNAGTFDLGSQAQANSSSETYVAWCWATAAQDSSSHTQGSITSQVRANATTGFSVVTYTGTGANATVGHGLGVAPGFIIIKNRSALTNWRVYHSALGNTKAIFLSTTGSSDTSSVYWNNTSPTSTVFSVGSDDGANGSTNLMVAYCFTPGVGYSSFGSYTGNGSADGPFVYTGFRPRWVLVKDTSSGNWRIYDTTRDSYNVSTAKLYPNSSVVENGVSGESASTNTLDVLSNGFKLRTSDSETNFSSNTYIFAAFAESPFNYSRAR